mgnify:CR=1 FL=1
MSLAALLDRLESEVPSVPLASEPEGTAKHLHNQAGSLGSLSSLREQDKSEVRRLWLIRHQDGRLISHSFCPPASRDEVSGWYPLALSIDPEDEEDEGGW